MTRDRFSRQLAIPAIGVRGQKKCANACIAIIGLGAIGSVSAELLCRAGIKQLVLIDHDIVEESNLPRQLLYAESDIGTAKADAAKKRLHQIFRACAIKSHAVHLDSTTLKLLDSADIILDGTDNFETRFLLASYALRAKKPFIYAGAIEKRGLVYAQLPQKNAPRFDELFPEHATAERCEDIGIINTTNTLTASVQTSLALRIILGEKLERAIYHVDSWNCTIEHIAVPLRKKDNKNKGDKGQEEKTEPKQQEHSNKYAAKSMRDLYALDFCTTKNMMRTRLKITERLDMQSIRSAFEVTHDAGIVCSLRIDSCDVIVYAHGELLFPRMHDEKKIRTIAEAIYTTGLR